MKPDENICCPHCQKPLGIQAVSSLLDESHFSFTMKPDPGSYLGAKTVGKCIESLGGLMDETGKAMGVKTRTVVEGMSFAEDGSITVKFIITQVAKRPTDTVDQSSTETGKK